jgi:hypothetical protein
MFPARDYRLGLATSSGSRCSLCPVGDYSVVCRSRCYVCCLASQVHIHTEMWLVNDRLGRAFSANTDVSAATIEQNLPEAS